MKSRICFAVIGACVAGLQGCGNFNSIYREFSVRGGDGSTKSITMDVKQRTVLSSTRQSRGENGNFHEKTVICAEPSPDALSVYAAGLSGSAYSGDKKAVDVALSQSETGSFIGNRTVTIQLLRDNLYRACEGYMSGALSEGQYYSLIRRYQVMTMGLLAIEHLSETVKPPNITITAGSASAGVGGGEQAIEKALDARAQANATAALSAKRRDALKDAFDKAKKEADDSPDDAGLKTKADNAEKAYTDAQHKALVDEDKAKAAAEQYENAKGTSGMVTRVKGGALLSASSGQQAKEQALAAATVATTTKEIVAMTINDGFTLDDCLSGDDACFSVGQRQSAIRVAQESCKGKVSDGRDAYSVCVMPILGLFKMNVDDATALVQSVELRKAELASYSASPQPAKSSDFASFAQGVTPKDAPSSIYRLDVFYVTDKDIAYNVIRNSDVARDFAQVKYRQITPDDCRQKFNIKGTQPAIIRYDNNPDEIKVKDHLLNLLNRLGQGMQAEAEQVKWTPTPLYISVFLCQQQ